MRKLIYKIEGFTVVEDPCTGEVVKKQNPAAVTVYNPTDTDIAKAAEIACNGEYTLEDDGQCENASADEVLNTMLGVTR